MMNNKSLEYRKITLLLLAYTLLLSFSYVLVSGQVRIEGFAVYNGQTINDTCNNTIIDNSSLLNTQATLYFRFNNESQYGENNNVICDFSGHHNTGYNLGANQNSTGGPYHDGAYQFNGSTSIAVKDNDNLSQNTTGKLSVSFWVKFDTLTFNGEAEGYEHYLGKGTWTNGYEWVFRQYNSSNSANRPNRSSFYNFNLTGGIGIGSYFQDNITTQEWIHIVGIINGTHTEIWKNGQIRDSDDYYGSIIPGNGTGDLYIGTSDGSSYLKGSIDELRIYTKTLNNTEIQTLYTLIPGNLTVVQQNNTNTTTNTTNTTVNTTTPILETPHKSSGGSGSGSITKNIIKQNITQEITTNTTQEITPTPIVLNGKITKEQEEITSLEQVATLNKGINGQVIRNSTGLNDQQRKIFFIVIIILTFIFGMLITKLSLIKKRERYIKEFEEHYYQPNNTINLN